MVVYLTDIMTSLFTYWRGCVFRRKAAAPRALNPWHAGRSWTCGFSPLPLLAALWAAAAPAASPFAVEARPAMHDGARVVEVALTVPPKHKLYSEEIRVSAGERMLTAVDAPAPVTMPDPFTGEPSSFYDASVTLCYPWPGGEAPEVAVEFMGCDETECFLPERHVFRLTAEGGERIAPADGDEPEPAAVSGWRARVERDFVLRARAGGYMNAPDFLIFLGDERGAAGAAAGASPLARGIVVTLLLVVLGGLALNLTPCVLPMIPINLAIIGAGAQAGTRRRGFVLGGLYGVGIALTYGALGLFALLAGATFGTLNANPWFNAALASLFVVLAAAMMGLLNIDFSRFQSAVGSHRPGRGTIALALFMGAVSALLAGACVAPALIGVLLLAGRLYADGQPFALGLPFLLGIGMALPWPFAGAGLSFLPKPGRWMNAVKYGFGLLILGFALYYGRLAWTLFRPTGYDPAAEERRLEEAFARGAREGRPVFIDVWATWCKNCHAMDRTTFQDPAVQRRLEEFVVVKYQAERPDREPARGTLRSMEVVGLPAYLIFDPKAEVR
jgi:thioredoxin:protein disulfide reductase